MKTVITSTGNRKDSKFDKRFGKARWFCLYDESTGETEFIRNEVDEYRHGACKLAVARISRLNPDKVISGHFGPGATRLLNKKGIQMVALEERKVTIQDIIDEIKQK